MNLERWLRKQTFYIVDAQSRCVARFDNATCYQYGRTYANGSWLEKRRDFDACLESILKRVGQIK